MSENQIEQLEKLKSLYEGGTISKEEMEKLKKDILFKTEINVPIQTAKKKPMGKYILISIGSLVLITATLFFLFNYKGGVINDLKNDLTELGLKGNVKSVLINNDGQFYEANGFNKDGFLIYKKQGYSAEFTMNYKRDDDNKLTELSAVRFDENGATIQEDVFKYYYNSDDFISRTEEYHAGQLIYKTLNNYNSSGNLSEIVTKYSDGKFYRKIMRKFDINDSIIENVETVYDDFQNNVTRSTFAFDSKGRKVKTTEYNMNESTISRQYEFVYDKIGNKIEEIISDNEGVLSRIKFVYDKSNNLVKEILIPNEGSEIITQYTYDDQGNWISKTRFNEDGSVSNESRVIQYYTDDELKTKSEIDFNLEFKNKSAENFESSDSENDEYESETVSFGEIRGRIIGGNLRMVERELGSAAYNENGANFIKNSFNMTLPMGLFDHCLGFRVYVYESYLDDGQNLLVIINEEGKVSNVLSQNDIEDVREICCCE